MLRRHRVAEVTILLPTLLGARLEGIYRFMSEMSENAFVFQEQSGSAPDEQQVRWLTGWLEEAEALPALSGGKYGPGPFPVPADLQLRSRAARAAVAEREPFAPRSVILPHAADDAVLNGVASRPDVHAGFAGVPWRVLYVDLSNVIAVQKLVVLDGLHQRVTGITKDSPELLDLCLPAQQRPTPVEAIQDLDGRSVTFSSPNPNLRFQGYHVNFGPGGGTVTFIVRVVSSYVTVVELGDRFFLRDGYHRAVALAAAGVTVVPAVVVTGSSYSDVAMTPGMLGPQVALGDHPPMLVDFLDAQVSDTSTRRRTRKVTRLSASEFAV